jgi:hypothetical protein
MLYEFYNQDDGSFHQQDWQLSKGIQPTQFVI